MPGMGKTSKGINYDIIRPDKQSKKAPTYNKGGRVGKQLGGAQLGGAEGNTRPITGTQRFDQSRGYYQPDMGMRGGAMYNKGGRVKANKGKLVGMRTEAQKKADEKLVAAKKWESRKARPPVRLSKPYKKTRS